MRIAEICSRSVSVIAPEQSIREAAELMRRDHIGDVVVARREASGLRPLGILTDRDLVVQLLAPGVEPDRIGVRDAMTQDLVVAREDEDLIATLQRMSSRGIRRIPVVDAAGLLTGILSIDDVLVLVGRAGVAIAEILSRGRERESALRS